MKSWKITVAKADIQRHIHATQLIIWNTLSLSLSLSFDFCLCNGHKRIELSKSNDIIMKFNIDTNVLDWIGISWCLLSKTFLAPTHTHTHAIEKYLIRIRYTSDAKKIIIWLIICTLFCIQTPQFLDVSKLLFCVLKRCLMFALFSRYGSYRQRKQRRLKSNYLYSIFLKCRFLAWFLAPTRNEFR